MHSNRAQTPESLIHVTFYRSVLCPRCFMARRYLQEIVRGDPSITIEEVDITKTPRRAWKDGIRCIPALRIQGETLSALYLAREQIRHFINTFR